MATEENVYLTASGKAVRIRRPRPDPSKISVRTKAGFIKKEVKYRKFRGKVLEVSSMWVNPHSKIVPIGERRRQQDLFSQDVAINTAYFTDLQNALDRAEQESQCEQEESNVCMVDIFQDVEELDS